MLVYFNPDTKQMVPVSEDSTVIETVEGKPLADISTTLAPGADYTPGSFETAVGFRTLNVFLTADNPAEVDVVWSFDGINVDGDPESVFEFAYDREAKAVTVKAPYFKLIPKNTHTASQAVTIKSYLVA